ncbi:hypothetical protein [Bradyrhizobium sp. Ash2021]|uniref:hypothetical protein n=1 Tax=Bradyrhizobium sp. Ash2021 TaxID=2954771 RepID=UPI002815310A|nr:hypothetical protein [Bradyrhizobium sp. Ash2021]WMT75396.1 hypothetical protein NL528_02905 [Bradyrhizobium sp. Ash2021]
MSASQPELFPEQSSPTALRVEDFIRTLLAGPARPSASELLRVIESALSPNARPHFEPTLNRLGNDKSLRRADTAYLQSMLADGSAAAALRGEGKADDETVSSIDALLRQTALYRSSAEFKDMVAFMGRFRDYAPYNVMLVRLQNPSCGFFATQTDWWKRHKRHLIDDAKPMLILAPMHPVMLVYALDQTAGTEVPKQLLEFARFEGEWNPKWLANLVENAARRRIGVALKELSSTHAGRATNDPGIDGWKMRITLHDKLDEPSQFGVLVHEMAHVLLGHLGTDYDHWWPGRFNVDNASAEIEAESVAHIVAARFGLYGSSAAYLSGYLADTGIPQGVSIDLIAKVAGEIERMAKGLLPAPKPRPPKPEKKK